MTSFRLLLTGADAVSLGITGAFMGGLLAAGAALGPMGLPRIFAAARSARAPAARAGQEHLAT